MANRLLQWAANSWVLVGLLILAAALRVVAAGEWSLWEDEETAVYFSQNPHRSFPSAFPIFFYLLRAWFAWTGISVLAGRLLVAAIGVVSILLTYTGFRRFYPPAACFFAALFLTLSLGHLFWSQSIRYYILLLCFEILSMVWFLDGFEHDSPWKLVLSNVALVLALFSHYSGALLMPVYVAFLALCLIRRESAAGYSARNYAVWFSTFALVGALFAWRFLQFRASMAYLISGASDPPRVLLQLLVYFGAPVVGLGLLGGFLARKSLPTRLVHYLLLAACLPVLELMVIGWLNLAVLTWYQAFFALVPFALLAGLATVELLRRERLVLACGFLAASLLYALPFLVGYFTSMHGDRPRWKDAAAFLLDRGGIRVDASSNPVVFASVPGSVAFHLGVPPGQTMAHPLVKVWPTTPPESLPAVEQWYVVEAGLLSSTFKRWLDNHCALEAHFDARSGPKDRSVVLYHYLPKSS